MKKILCVSLALCTSITLTAGQAIASEHAVMDAAASLQVLASDEQRLKNADSGLDRFRDFMWRDTEERDSGDS